ncbi:MAG: hypothetical protein BRC51_03540 [Cyanobacteria bacterium SW_12_48_29]|nr:MAG: hypothetical protein BRC45_13975 [Cyanobacteria bacterium QS_5_48_63]PSO83912.1 MAG: hypothetical protein BRC43_17060 [Cyanobacteria bacterium QS_3_48_167]PSO95469.1 MAG: hypothetical protein BRC46_02965 [Cyanobacteria bacterium QS_6_48_18]PSP06499.1 MAG: hypothetical protein BRC51_03540 [Cyanobacteria bacterium SW_12_48_29]PSP12359.1 MAG: hypothetical protein BRC49_05595 [Cyanobacteria bacterium SW_10_48_33]PSP14416.1 MAG: hypothetical protein BRC50_03570 [Cyanobacteria bacterium SW_1
MASRAKNLRISTLLFACLLIGLLVWDGVGENAKLIPTAGVFFNWETKLANRLGLQSPRLTTPSFSNLNASARQTTPARDDYRSLSLAKIAKSQSITGKKPLAIALKAFSASPSHSPNQQLTLNSSVPEQAIVTYTQTDLADDSVAGIRYRVEFLRAEPSSQTEKQWKMVWAGSQLKCRPGRGHQNWSQEDCI